MSAKDEKNFKILYLVKQGPKIYSQTTPGITTHHYMSAIDILPRNKTNFPCAESSGSFF